MLVPLLDLMSLAPATWYVHALAAYPEYRGRGLGFALLGLAEKLAAAVRTHGMSLVVSDTNTAARRLYEGSEFREIGQRKIVKEEWQHPGVNWVLLRKDL